MIHVDAALKHTQCLVATTLERLSFLFNSLMRCLAILKLAPALFDFTFSCCFSICWHGLSVNELLYASDVVLH